MNYKRLQVSAEMFFSFFTAGKHLDHGYEVTGDPLPSDARMINVRQGWPDVIEILVESATFPNVKPGDEIPLIVPLCTRIVGKSKS